jgi:hypothetical protein
MGFEKREPNDRETSPKYWEETGVVKRNLSS